MISINFRNKQTGFTIVELLVVVSIIGFLASIVLTNVVRARNSAIQSTTLQNTINLAKGLELYAEDNNGIYPAGNHVSDDSTSWGQLKTFLQPYMPRLPESAYNGINFNYYWYIGPGQVTTSTSDAVGLQCIDTRSGYWLVSFGDPPKSTDEGGILSGAYEIKGGNAQQGHLGAQGCQ